MRIWLCIFTYACMIFRSRTCNPGQITVVSDPTQCQWPEPGGACETSTESTLCPRVVRGRRYITQSSTQNTVDTCKVSPKNNNNKNNIYSNHLQIHIAQWIVTLMKTIIKGDKIYEINHQKMIANAVYKIHYTKLTNYQLCKQFRIRKWATSPNTMVFSYPIKNKYR